MGEVVDSVKTFEQQASPFAKAGLIVGISLVLGFLFDFLIYGKFPGLAFFIYVVIITLAFFGISWFYGGKISGGVLWLLVPLLFFSAMIAVRASILLTFLNAVAVLLLMLLIAQVAFSERLRDFRIMDYVSVVVLPLFFVVPLFKTLADLFMLRGVAKNRRFLMQVLTGVAITIPVLLVFFLLFASADLVFHQVLTKIIDFKISPEFIFRTMLVFLATLAFIGSYSYIFRKSEPGVGFPVAVEVERKTGGFGHIESSILLGSVNTLFFVFILVQITYLFGGLHNISAQGFTYAQYARRGFFELVAVALIALAMLLLLERFIARPEKGHAVLFRSLSTVLVVQVMVILASSLTRMSLYENAYGFTELRLYVHIFIFFIAAVYLALLYKIHIDDRETTFIFKVFLMLVAFLALMNVINPDAYIARQNMQRYSKTGRIDINYLGSLSDDSLPVTISLLNAKDDNVKKQYAGKLHDRAVLEKKPIFSRWQSLNLSRERAKEILKDKEEEIEGLRE